MELHGPLASAGTRWSLRPVAVPIGDEALPAAGRRRRVRRDRHLRLPHLADLRAVRLGRQLPGVRAGAGSRAHRQHLPRGLLLPRSLRARGAGHPRHDPRRLPADDGHVVGHPARQHHRHARLALLRRGGRLRRRAQARRRRVGPGGRDHPAVRGQPHLPPRVLRRHPHARSDRPVLLLRRPAVREVLRRHGAALHRRRRPRRRVREAPRARHGLPLQRHPPHRRQRRLPDVPGCRGVGEDHREVVLRDGHRRGPGRLRSDDAFGARPRLHGWISVEHDKADKLGGDYAESTAIARWYAKNVLDGIYTEEVAR